MRLPSRAHLLVFAVVLVLPLVGCSTWKPHVVSAPETLAQHPDSLDGRFRVTLKSGELVLVEYPRIAACGAVGAFLVLTAAAYSGHD